MSQTDRTDRHDRTEQTDRQTDRQTDNGPIAQCEPFYIWTFGRPKPTTTVITRAYLLYSTIVLFTITMQCLNIYRLLIDNIFRNWSSTDDIYMHSFLAVVRQLCLLAKVWPSPYR